jgi:hypothetical protein
MTATTNSETAAETCNGSNDKTTQDDGRENNRMRAETYNSNNEGISVERNTVKKEKKRG